MYNFALAFVICGVVYFIGEAVSNLTKAWIPSVFVTAAVLLVGFWTVIPTTVVSDSMLIPFGSTIGIYLLITHMGTVISVKQLVAQWKTIVVCLAGLAGMCALCMGILPGIIGRDFVIAGLPPLTGGIVIPGINMKISGAVYALILGIIFTTIGFLDENVLNKANSYGIIMFALMMYVFDGLKDCTPDMLASIIGPMILLIVVGVAGMAILCFIVAKVLKMSFLLSFATALTALYGFPPNAVITEATCTALAKTPEEKEFLMSKMFPPMIVGGFTTVTITSVVIAGVFAGML